MQAHSQWWHQHTFSSFLLRCALPAKPSSAHAMEPMVTAMCSHDRNVRSLAKKVLGSIFMGVELSVVLRLISGLSH